MHSETLPGIILVDAPQLSMLCTVKVMPYREVGSRCAPTHTSIEKSRSLRCTLSHQGYADPWFPISSPLLDEQQDEKRGQVKEDTEHWPDEVR